MTNSYPYRQPHKGNEFYRSNGLQSDDMTVVLPAVPVDPPAEKTTSTEDTEQEQGLRSWFDIKRFMIEILLTGFICGIVAGFTVAVLDQLLSKLSSSYTVLGTGFYITSGFLIFIGTLLATGIFMLLLLGTRNVYRLYTLLFWAIIPATLALIALKTLSLTAAPYAALALIWSIPVSMIPARADQNRLD